MKRPLIPSGRRFKDFAYPLDSLAELDPHVAARLGEYLAPGEPLEKIIIAPRQRLIFQVNPAWRPTIDEPQRSLTADWIIVLTARRLLVATISPADTLARITSTPIDSILSLELGQMILYCWLGWTWAEGDRLQRGRIYFNGVRYSLFLSAVQWIQRRLAGYDSPAGAPPGGRHSRDEALLAGLPFKFRNLSGEILLPEEPLEALYFQPQAWEKVLGLYPRLVAPAWAGLRTAQYLSIVQEVRESRDKGYGILNRFFPRRWIESAAVVQQKECTELALLLRDGQALQQAGFRLQRPDELALRSWLSPWM